MTLRPLLSATLAFGASEAAAKATRLLTVLAVARGLPPAEIGLAAAAMAGGDILKGLTETGAGQRIIAASDTALEATCLGAARAMRLWCGGLFIAQIAVAALFWASGAHMVALCLALLAAEHLFMPAGIVSAALAMREGRMRGVATVAGAQICAANLGAAALALVWPSALALVLPRLLSAPIWLIAIRRLRPWTPTAVTPAPLGPFVRFGASVIGVELVRALRMQADKLVVGALMGAQALGLYFMAWSAGLGMASALTAAVSMALFPHAARGGALRVDLTVALLAVAPAVALQSLAAPYYVPLLFGAEHAHLAPVVATLCLSAIPLAIWQVAALRLRAQGRPDLELAGGALLAIALVAAVALLAPQGLLAAARGQLVATTFVALACAAPVLLAQRSAKCMP
ncbi:oligosaccharide flippase family protein [Jannaschia sp.]|nr:oligosaccharide flippase family protein [Jannaschia sp.]